jgi:hypothetical protein
MNSQRVIGAVIALVLTGLALGFLARLLWPRQQRSITAR